MKLFENYSSPPRHTSSWNVTGRVLVSANAFGILLTRAWNLSAFRSLLYFPSSRIIRKQGANLCGKHRVNLNAIDADGDAAVGVLPGAAGEGIGRGSLG